MRKGGKFNSIQEANERLEKRHLNEDETDSTDAHHSEDPAQIDMFTQHTGDIQDQLIQKFISKSDINEKVQSFLKIIEDKRVVFEQLSASFDDVYTGAEQHIPEDEKLDDFNNALTEISVAIMNLEDAIFDLMDKF